MRIETLCVHGEEKKIDATGAVVEPIYQSATFAHPGVGESTGYDYSRLQNPTRQVVEEKMAVLEEAVDCIAFSTGMAAISVMMELFSIGDHLIVSDDLYGGTRRLFDFVSKKNGLTFDVVHTSYIEEIRGKINANTKAILIETPSNPMMQVTDIEAVAKLAKEHNCLLIVDNTFLTPYFQKPILLGADLVIHSGTKFLCGHNDTLCGFLVIRNQELSEKLRFLCKTIGASLSPFDSWLVNRGIKTLGIRMEAQQKNAMELAQWLEQQEKIEKVFYVGLPSHPDYEVSCKQAKGFGSMISFEVDSEETAKQILSRVQLILFAESLGGVESLITYPMYQTHADVPEEEREDKGIQSRLLRLSVGIENVEDLKADLFQALKGEK